MSLTVRRDTEGARAGDFIMSSDGTLGVFDGMGTRGLKEGEQELYDSGATNVDGTKRQQSTPQTPLIPGANTSSGEAMKTGLRTGASQFIGGSADYHIDTQIMKSVPMEQKVAMVDQMAARVCKNKVE